MINGQNCAVHFGDEADYNYVDEAYGISQLASSYLNMTGLEMTLIINAPVYNYINRVITGLLHSTTYMTPCHSAVESKHSAKAPHT